MFTYEISFEDHLNRCWIFETRANLRFYAMNQLLNETPFAINITRMKRV